MTCWPVSFFGLNSTFLPAWFLYLYTHTWTTSKPRITQMRQTNQSPWPLEKNTANLDVCTFLSPREAISSSREGRCPFVPCLLLDTCLQKIINICFLVTAIHRAIPFVRSQNWTEIQAVTKGNICYKSLGMFLKITKLFSHVRTNSNVCKQLVLTYPVSTSINEFFPSAWLTTHFSCVSWLIFRQQKALLEISKHRAWVSKDQARIWFNLLLNKAPSPTL